MPTPPQPEAAELAAERLRLEVAKLKAETWAAERQLRPTASLLEWLKAAAVPIAIIGAGVSLYTANRSNDVAREYHEAERVAGAIAQLSTGTSQGRLAAVAQLGFYMRRSTHEKGAALTPLAMALSAENDPAVASAILATIGTAKEAGVDQESLDATLEEILQGDRDRVVSIRSAKDPIRATSAMPDAAGNVQGATTIAERSASDVHAAVARAIGAHAREDLLDRLRKDAVLERLSRVIVLLVAQGARARSFDEIFCDACDFKKVKRADNGISFQGALLPDADFERTDLHSANFKNAVLSRASFVGADLRDANLTVDSLAVGLGEIGPPVFACADLRGSDLSGQPLLIATTSLTSFPTVDLEGLRLDQTKVDHRTRLKSLAIATHVEIDKQFAMSHQHLPAIRHRMIPLMWRVEREAGRRIPLSEVLSIWPDTLTLESFGAATINQRTHPSYVSGAAIKQYLQHNGIGNISRFGPFVANATKLGDRFGNGPTKGPDVRCDAPDAVDREAYSWRLMTLLRPEDFGSAGGGGQGSRRRIPEL